MSGGVCVSAEIDTRWFTKRRLLYIALLSIIVFDVVYSLVFLAGPTNLSEDNAYVDIPLAIMHGNFVLNSIDGGRVLEYLPILAMYSLFGVSNLTSTAWNIMLFAGSVLLAFLIGRELYNGKAGLLAALLMSFFIPVVNGATRIEINEAMMFFTALALFVLLYAHNRKSGRWMFAAGILLAISPLTIPIAFYAVLVALVYVLVELARKKLGAANVLLLFAGMAVAAVVILFASYAVSGDPLVLVNMNHIYYSNLTMTQTTFGIIGAPVAYQAGSVNDLNYYLSYYPSRLLAFGTFQALAIYISSGNANIVSLLQSTENMGLTDGYYFIAVLVAIAYLVFWRDRRMYFPLLWLGIGFAFLQFAPQGMTLSPFRWILIFRDIRYVASIAVPTCVILAIALVRFLEAKGRSGGHRGRLDAKSVRAARNVLVVAILLFLIATSIPVNLLWSTYIYTEYYSLHAIANMFVGSTSNVTLYFPSGDYPQLPIYVGENPRVKLVFLDNTQNCSQFAAGSYVIIPNATAHFAPPFAYINDTSMYCPNLVFLEAPYYNVTPAPFDNFQNILLENRQSLYYVRGNAS